MARVITLDAGVLIAMLDGSDTHHDWATRLLIDHTEAQFVMSALTNAECLVRPAQAGVVQRFLDGIHGLDIDVVEVTETGALHLAQVRADTKLRMPDAAIIATALARASAVATTDRAVAEAARGQGLTVFGPR